MTASASNNGLKSGDIIKINFFGRNHDINAAAHGKLTRVISFTQVITKNTSSSSDDDDGDNSPCCWIPARIDPKDVVLFNKTGLSENIGIVIDPYVRGMPRHLGPGAIILYDGVLIYVVREYLKKL